MININAFQRTLIGATLLLAYASTAASFLSAELGRNTTLHRNRTMIVKRHIGLHFAIASLFVATCYAQGDSTASRVRYDIRVNLPVEDHSTPPLFLPLIEALQDDVHLESVLMHSAVEYSVDEAHESTRRNGNRPANLAVQYGFASFEEFQEWYTNSPVQGLLESMRSDHNALNIDVSLYVMRRREPDLNATLDMVK